eukprot:4276148-Prymnesium_polylepis.1
MYTLSAGSYPPARGGGDQGGRSGRGWANGGSRAHYACGLRGHLRGGWGLRVGGGCVARWAKKPPDGSTGGWVRACVRVRSSARRVGARACVAWRAWNVEMMAMAD